MHPLEYAIPIFKVEQANERLSPPDVCEKVLSCIVSGNACGHYHAHPTGRRKQSSRRLGEHSVGVDITLACKWEAYFVVREVASSLRVIHGVIELIRQPWVAPAHFGDEPVTGSFVRCIRYRPVACGEEFLLLELYAFPRRVTEHDIEATVVEYFWELDVPVEEAPALCNLHSVADEHAVSGIRQ